jgi:transglutaminase-like putative cysteine protease
MSVRNAGPSAPCRALKKLVTAAMLLAACGGMAHASKDVQLPDWMLQASTDAPLKSEWRDARAVYLLEDTLLTVGADGRAVERYRAAVKILRPQGREYAHPVAWFSKDEKLESFHVWSIGPDGHHYAMKDAEYVETGDVGAEEGVLYGDVRMRIASPPGADPGGVVAWEYVKDRPPYFAESTWSFQNPVPTVRSVYEIDLPAGWHKEAVWSRHASVDPVEVSPDHFRWEQSNIDGIDLSDIPLAPEWEALAGRMTVHFSADPLPEGDALWSKIGNWYYNLAAPQSEGGGDVATTARTLAGDGDFMEKLARVADFMQQQIRYVGIEIGIGGWQPHPAQEIFRSRYGDCKDKATLMVAMLDAVGIRAAWVSVDARRGVIDPKAPSLFGNHMIAAIEIPKGYENPRLQAVVTTRTGKRYLIFDPTNPYVPVGQLPDYEQGSYGVLAAGDDSQLIQLPILNPGVESIDRKAKFDLAADGTLKGDITVLRYGALSDRMRGRLAMDSEKEQRELVERSLQHDFSTFTLGDEKVAHVRELDQPLEMDYSVTAPLYAKDAGNLLLVRMRVVGSDADGLDDKPRKVPISFEGVGTWRDDFDVKIPAGYLVDDVPDPVNMDVGFATYHSEVKAEDGALHYTREYVVKKLELAPGEYSELRRLESAIATDENSDAVLKKQ